MDKIVLSIMAHPDDTEFLSAGTLGLLKEKGWEIHIATMTAGDCGSAELGCEQISRVRRGEAAKSAEILGGQYHCLECDDAFIMYDRGTLLKVTGLLRKVRPAIVFTMSPSDYMVDHEMTSKIVQTACFCVGIPNIDTGELKAFEAVPYLYYADAIAGTDKFGDEIKPRILVDISSVMKKKEQMLCCHDSQRKWLKAYHGIDQYIIAMKEFAEQRGQFADVGYGEGFRQHLGHAYPQDNILKAEFGDLAID